MTFPSSHNGGTELMRIAGRRMVCLFGLLALIFLIESESSQASEVPSPPEYGVRMEQAWIPMKDGIRLAATLYMPDGAQPTEKFPALLEYLPYRKDDGPPAPYYPIPSYFALPGYLT